MPLTPLMKAAKEEKSERVKELLKDGADGTATNEGFTALHYATSFNSKDLSLIQFLLEKYPALINAGNITPLDYAYASNKSAMQDDIITFLKSKGAKANHWTEEKEIARVEKERVRRQDLAIALQEEKQEQAAKEAKKRKQEAKLANPVYIVLKKLTLEKFYDLFISQGVETVDDLEHVNVDDLDKLEQNRFRSWLKKGGPSGNPDAYPKTTPDDVMKALKRLHMERYFHEFVTDQGASSIEELEFVSLGDIRYDIEKTRFKDWIANGGLEGSEEAFPVETTENALKNAGLSDYVKHFIDHGYYFEQELCHVADHEMKPPGINLVKMNKLKKTLRLINEKYFPPDE